MRFEIMRLDDVDGTPVDCTVVDAASVNRIVQQAAAIGQRLWIRPADTSAPSPETHRRGTPPKRQSPRPASTAGGGSAHTHGRSARADHLGDPVDDLLH